MTAFRLDAEELDVVWTSLRLGGLPHPLTAPSIGATRAERELLAEPVRDRLAARGLWSGRGPDDDVADLLAVLAAPGHGVDAVGHLAAPSPATGAAGPLRALGAAARGTAALAVVHPDGSVAVRGLRPAGLAHALVELLPAARPGPGHALSVPMSDVRALAADDDEEDNWADGAGAPRQRGTDTRALTELAANRVAGGQFGATSAGARVQPLITWFDTGDGRYLAISDGDWLSIAPADNDRINHRLTAVLKTAL